MVRSLENIALCRLRKRTGAMEIAEPFWMLGILEMRPRPIRDEFEAFEIPLFASYLKRLQIGDYRFALRPPEFHILFVALRREVAAVTEGYYDC